MGSETVVSYEILLCHSPFSPYIRCHNMLLFHQEIQVLETTQEGLQNCHDGYDVSDENNFEPSPRLPPRYPAPASQPCGLEVTVYGAIVGQSMRRSSRICMSLDIRRIDQCSKQLVISPGLKIHLLDRAG